MRKSHNIYRQRSDSISLEHHLYADIRHSRYENKHQNEHNDTESFLFAPDIGLLYKNSHDNTESHDRDISYRTVQSKVKVRSRKHIFTPLYCSAKAAQKLPRQAITNINYTIIHTYYITKMTQSQQFFSIILIVFCMHCNTFSIRECKYLYKNINILLKNSRES